MNLKGKLLIMASLLFFSVYLRAVTVDDLKKAYEEASDEYIRYIKQFTPNDPYAKKLKAKVEKAKKQYKLFVLKNRKIFSESEIDHLIGFDYSDKKNILALAHDMSWKSDFKLMLLNIRFYNFNDAILLLDIIERKLDFLNESKPFLTVWKAYCALKIGELENKKDMFEKAKHLIESNIEDIKDSYYKKKARILLDKARASIILFGQF